MDGIKVTPSLGSTYDSIKASITPNNGPLIGSTPTGPALDALLAKHGNHLKDNCYKHILLDVYCKILPLDDDYKCGHMGQMRSDIENMLKSKGMTATQYLTACKESTNSSLLEFITRSVDGIASRYMKEARDEVEKNKATGMDVPVEEPPEDPTEDDNINDQLIDVESDTEYDMFVDTLKKKTIDKIVDDVTKIINDEKETADMTFDPKPLADIQETNESTTSMGMQYLQHQLVKENVDVSGMTEELLGYAIRESTLNQFDVVFNQPSGTFREFTSRVRYGKGAIINESAVAYIIESVSGSDEFTEATRYAKEYRQLELFRHNLYQLSKELKELANTYTPGSKEYNYIMSKREKVKAEYKDILDRLRRYGKIGRSHDSIGSGRSAAKTISQGKTHTMVPGIATDLASYDIEHGKKRKEELKSALLSTTGASISVDVKKLNSEVSKLFNKYMNESADKSSDEINKTIEDANKERDEKIDSKLKASDILKNKEKGDQSSSPLK